MEKTLYVEGENLEHEINVEFDVNFGNTGDEYYDIGDHTETVSGKAYAELDTIYGCCMVRHGDCASKEDIPAVCKFDYEYKRNGETRYAWVHYREINPSIGYIEDQLAQKILESDPYDFVND